MREMGLEAIYPKPNLSKAKDNVRKYPYLLKEEEITVPNQVWSTDITYISLHVKSRQLEYTRLFTEFVVPKHG